jgi:hypothetical protein
MKFPDGEFELGYGRMPLLTALLEIVVTIVGYEAIDQILSDMTTGAADEAAISDAANAVNRLVYNWLKDHLPGTQAGEKFETIVRFLSSTGKDGSVEISDDTILAFWQRQNDGQGGASDFRTFRSALGGFVDFLRAVETGSTRSMVSFARPLGTDHDAGEVDPMFDDDDAPAGAWQTPLALLDMPPADAIKFLNKRERDDLDLLMDCGPLAIDLPLSVLRCEVFGTVQGRITQALRRKVAKKEIHQLAACGEAEPYGERTGRYHDHEQHLLRVQKAVLHALTSDDVDDEDTEARQPETSDTSNVIPLFGRNTLTDTAREQSQDAFKTLNRKGFSQNDLDNPDIREGFSIGAGALVQARDHLADFLVVLARLQTGDEDLAQVFAHDRTTFSDLFAAMYGAKK